VGSPPTRRATLPPVRGRSARGVVLDQARDHLEVLPAPGPAELPQLASRSVVLVDRLVDFVGVGPSSAILIDHGGGALDEFGQAGLVVRGDLVTRSLTLAPGTHADDTYARRSADVGSEQLQPGRRGNAACEGRYARAIRGMSVKRYAAMPDSGERMDVVVTSLVTRWSARRLRVTTPAGIAASV
jgi:hypothetical protein